MSLQVLGIDIGKKKFDVALTNQHKFKTKVFNNNRAGHEALDRWLARQGAEQVHVCMEATGAYWQDLAEFLHDRGHKVSVVNPAQIHAFAQGKLTRTKTDRQDAKLIARFCEVMSPALWQPRPVEERALFALVRRLEAVKAMHDQEQTRLETAHEAVVPDIQAHIAALAKTIVELEKRIRDHIDRHPGLREKRALLESIPGVGEATVAQILARWSTLAALKSPKQWAAHVGLSPGERSSGRHQPASAAIVRVGDARLRKALYMPAVVAKRHNPVLRDFAKRLETRGKKPKQVVVACMRKLLHLMYGIIKSGRRFDPDHHNASLVAQAA